MCLCSNQTVADQRLNFQSFRGRYSLSIRSCVLLVLLNSVYTQRKIVIRLRSILGHYTFLWFRFKTILKAVACYCCCCFFFCFHSLYLNLICHLFARSRGRISIRSLRFFVELFSASVLPKKYHFTVFLVALQIHSVVRLVKLWIKC